MKTASEIRMALIEKAGEDEDFRAHLLADPKSAIEGEFDVTVPEDFSLHVHEENPGTAHLVLPPSPGLSSEELAAVSGASNYYIPNVDSDVGAGSDPGN